MLRVQNLDPATPGNLAGNSVAQKNKTKKKRIKTATTSLATFLLW